MNIRNRKADVPWMWMVIGIIIAVLLLVLGFVVIGKVSTLGDAAIYLIA